jgi:hypothetical protein
MRNYVEVSFFPHSVSFFPSSTRMKPLKGEYVEKLHVKCTLTGEPARMVRELKERGLVRSIREAMVQGILVLYERTAERDLKRAQARASLRLEEEASG